MQQYYVYLAKCNDGSLYCGVSTDVRRRIHEHNFCKTGAAYTKPRRPVELVYQSDPMDKSKAFKEEYRIKKLSRVEKIKLIAPEAM